MTKNELKKYVEALIAAPSCCPEAKDAGEKYLAALGTEEEAAAGTVAGMSDKQRRKTIDVDIARYIKGNSGDALLILLVGGVVLGAALGGGSSQCDDDDYHRNYCCP